MKKILIFIQQIQRYYMQRNTLNLIVFDEEQLSYPDQSFLARKTSLGNSMGFDIVTQQMESLYSKIRNLQRTIEHLTKQNTSKRVQIVTQQQSFSSSHYDNILFTIQLRIQMILKETQILMKKITTNFQRKLQQKLTNQSNANFSQKMYQMQCQLRHIETQYANQLVKIQTKNKQIQQQTNQRLTEIQQQYTRKIQQFQTKQKDYVGKIQQLEKKIRKNKKMIEITQDKNREENVHKNGVFQDYLTNHNRYNSIVQTNSKNTINDTSNIRRKIFKKDQNRSISPQQRRHTTRNFVMHHDHNYDNNSHHKNTIESCRIMNDNIVEKKATITQNIKQSKQIKLSNETEQMFQITPTAEDFYKDVPKANWENFDCFDRNEDSEQDQDVFFYPEHKKNKKQLHQINQSDNFLSPLDLN